MQSAPSSPIHRGRMHDHDVVGERRPTRFERGDRERRLPGAAGAEEQERAPVAHDRGAVEDKAIVAGEQPGERQVDATFEEGQRRQVGQVHVGPVADHRDHEPRWRGDDDPVGFGPELDARAAPSAAVESGRWRASRPPRSWHTAASGVGSKTARLARRHGRARRPTPGTRRAHRRCRPHGRARAAEGSLTVSDHRTTRFEPGSAGAGRSIPGLVAGAALQAGVRRAPDRACATRSPKIRSSRPTSSRRSSAGLPRSWIRAEHAQYSPHEPRGMSRRSGDVDLEARGPRTLPRRPRRSAPTTSSSPPSSASSTPRSAHGCAALVGERRGRRRHHEPRCVMASPR